VNLWVNTYISEKHTASIFRVEIVVQSWKRWQYRLSACTFTRRFNQKANCLACSNFSETFQAKISRLMTPNDVSLMAEVISGRTVDYDDCYL